MVCFDRPQHFKFFKWCLSHKFYLVHSWIPCLTCEWLLLIFKNFSFQLGDKTEEEVASIVESARAKAFDESINRAAILKVDPWRFWVCKQWIWNSLSIIHIFTRKTFWCWRAWYIAYALRQPYMMRRIQ